MRRVRVVVTLRPGMLDPAGQAVAQGLRSLGYDVGEVRVGKVVDLEVPDGTDVEELCRTFLANPLVETWEVLPGVVA